MRAQSRTAKTSPAKSSARPAAAPAAAPAAGERARPIDAERRRAMIAQAAYFRAEKRGFAPGAELQDWLEAEAEIDRELGEPPLLAHQLAHSDT